MKGRISDLNSQHDIVVDFELSETPTDIIMRLVNSESRENVIPFFPGEREYEYIKYGETIIESANSTFAVLQKGGDVADLVWDTPLKAQIDEQIQANSKEIRFYASIFPIA